MSFSRAPLKRFNENIREYFDDLKTGDPDVNKTKVFLWSASP